MKEQEEAGMGETYRPFVVIEAAYMAWFTLEFFVRLLSSPSKVKFLRKVMNLVDLLAILPYYISLVFYRSVVVVVVMLWLFWVRWPPSWVVMVVVVVGKMAP